MTRLQVKDKMEHLQDFNELNWWILRCNNCKYIWERKNLNSVLFCPRCNSPKYKNTDWSTITFNCEVCKLLTIYNSLLQKRKKRLLFARERGKNLIVPFKDTTIEIKIQNFLKQLNIEFFTHQYIKDIENKYRCDIFIPIQIGIPQKTIIECDGDYYHGNQTLFPNLEDWQLEQIKRDQLRTKELVEKGYRVIRIWECEIRRMNMNNLKEKLYG